VVLASAPFVADFSLHCACRNAATRRARARSESLNCRFCWHPKPRILRSTDAPPIPQMQMCAPAAAGQSVEMAVMPVSLSLRTNEPPRYALAPAPMLPLPPGWEHGTDALGQIYFLDHSSGTTTWTDPRLAPARYDSGPSAATLRRATVESDLARPSPAVARVEPRTGPAAPAPFLPTQPDVLRCSAGEGLRAVPAQDNGGRRNWRTAKAHGLAETGLAPIQKLPDGWRHETDPDGRCSALPAYAPRDWRTRMDGRDPALRSPSVLGRGSPAHGEWAGRNCVRARAPFVRVPVRVSHTPPRRVVCGVIASLLCCVSIFDDRGDVRGR
jgi:hypothetical protein